MVIVYLHGFLSSPKSNKAQQTARWLRAQRPDTPFYCPILSAYPAKAEATLQTLVRTIRAQHSGASIGLIGSSLGGFWASYLIENDLADKAVLINPAVSPQTRFTDLIERPLPSYYSDEIVQLSKQDLHELSHFDPPAIDRPKRYWLMVQAGDETLDYRHAVARYQLSRQQVEAGGSHAFDNYHKHLSHIINFFENE